MHKSVSATYPNCGKAPIRRLVSTPHPFEPTRHRPPIVIPNSIVLLDDFNILLFVGRNGN